MNKELLHILVVDDDPELAELLKLSLLDKSLQVTLAMNGKDALQLFKKNHYDCVVTDVLMPVMTGVEFVAELRLLNSLVQVYFITGHLDYSNKILNALNPIAIFYKPFDLEEAALLIKKQLLK